MRVTSFYPVLLVSDVSVVSEYFVETFGFTRVFRSEWYAHLKNVKFE